MATPRLKPAKPVDPVGFEPVMIALSEARALAWFLAKLGDEDSSLVHGIAEDAEQPPAEQPDDVIPWVQQAIAARLRQAHDTIERAYRSAYITTNLLEKEVAALKPQAGA